YLAALTLRSCMRTAPATEIGEIAGRIVMLDPAQACFAIIVDAATEMVTRFTNEPVALAQIATDTRWPAPARHVAFTAVGRNPNSAFPVLLQQISKAGVSGPEMIDALSRIARTP